MPLEDFTRKKWKVNEVEGNVPCSENDMVIITEQSPKVTIECGGTTFDGWYDEKSNTIKGENDSYVIELQIKFTGEVRPSSGGSWTAEDQGPWPGDG